MKTIQTLVMAMLIATTSVLQASTEPTKDERPTTICQAVGQLLDSPDFQLDKETTVKVTFTVNKENEIVVLETTAANDFIEDYIKTRLNYKKLNVPAECGKYYFLPVRIKESK